MRRLLLFAFMISLSFFSYGQSVQTVTGVVVDQQSEIPLIGATIQWINDSATMGTSTDLDGRFRLEGVAVGRQSFLVSYLGYETITLPNVEITAGKMVYLEISLQESLLQLDEVVITGRVDKDRAQNDMATISSRQFSMEEVNRFSGGRSDVGRLAGNFAGVSTADDSRNDIVIRGNSPTGLLWRLEGIPIPSPNHFATAGTTGGPVSALNTNLLSNSDFLTSAFPAEYGDALSGVFDLSLRNGNKEETEYTFQLGAITGVEGMVEGPISKEKGSSYLVSGRYSFLGFAQAVGMNIGTNAVPNYSDLSFKIDLGNQSYGRFTLFGIGGRSNIDFLHDEVDETDLFAANDEDAFADSEFGVIGVKHNLILDSKSYLKTVVGASTSSNQFSVDRYYNLDQEDEFVLPYETADNTLSRVTFSSLYNRKVNAAFTFRAGLLLERFFANMAFESAEFGMDLDNNGILDLATVYQFDGQSTLAQPYVQSQWRLSDQMTINAGLHSQYSSLNEDFVLEPRIAFNYQIHPRHTLNLGYGLHHQSQPLPIQLGIIEQSDGTILTPNRNLAFSRSNHFVLGHDFNMGKSWRYKFEVYYQYLDQIPVDIEQTSFSLLNVGADFGFPIDKNNLVNEGTGYNTGIELTLEKFFTDGYYMLLTGSIFDSKYTASDGVERNTAFNNQYVLNVLGGKEFSWGKENQHRFTIDTKLTTAGGRYFTPVDLASSQENGIEVLDESRAFSQQYDPYFRWDIKLGVKLNSRKKKLSHSFYIDIQNVTNNQNIFRSSYNRVTNEVNNVYQIGFFPNFIYKVEF